MMTLAKKDFPALAARAHEAGLAAAEAAKPQEISVVDVKTGRVFAPFPICGFAWVVVKPATSSFARWAKKELDWRPGYPTGMHMWVTGFGQSYDLKLAYARGFAAVLKDAGLDAYADGRLD